MKAREPRLLIAYLMVIVAITSLGFSHMPFRMAAVFAIMVLIAGFHPDDWTPHLSDTVTNRERWEELERLAAESPGPVVLDLRALRDLP